MSGGPVLDNRGFVRGVVTAGAATITGEPSSIVSLLYPAFNTELRFGAQIGPMRIDATRPLFELVGDGFIKTDGSETMVTLQPDSDDLLVGIMSPRAESDHVFDDFPGLQKGLPPTKAAGTHYRLKYHTED